MDLYVDLGQVGMSWGEFEKAGSPCRQQLLHCQGTTQGSGGMFWGVPCVASLSCFRLTWIMTLMREGFLWAHIPRRGYT